MEIVTETNLVILNYSTHPAIDFLYVVFLEFLFVGCWISSIMPLVFVPIFNILFFCTFYSDFLTFIFKLFFLHWCKCFLIWTTFICHVSFLFLGMLPCVVMLLRIKIVLLTTKIEVISLLWIAAKKKKRAKSSALVIKCSNKYGASNNQCSFLKKLNFKFYYRGWECHDTYV